MGRRAPWLLAALVAGLVAVAALASAEPAPRHLCTHREDRADLGTPVHKARGGRGDIQHRLPEGTRVTVVQTQGNWSQIRYLDPSPEAAARSEPRRFTGWVTKTYLTTCLGPSTDEDLAEQMARQASAMLREEVEAERRRHVTLCWWNAKRLGHGKRDWAASARAIRGCDVVGLGEVMRPEAPAKLASAMPGSWKAATSEKAVGSKSYREHYAVIYDDAQVDEVEGGLRGFYPDPGDGFVREPWAVTLKAGAFDFTLALLHVTWGKRAEERAAELSRVDDAFAWFQAQDAEENDIIILAGDFNRTPDQEGWGEVVGAGLRLLLKGLPGTTVTMKGSRVNLYDQIVIDPSETTEWTGTAGVVDDVGMEYGAFAKSVSDHLPVWASFETSGSRTRPE